MPEYKDFSENNESDLNSEAWLKTFKEIIFQVNRDGAIQQFSNGSNEILNLDSKEIIGKNLLDLPIFEPKEQKNKLKKTLSDAFEQKHDQGFYLESEHKNSNIRRFVNICIPVDSENPENAWVILNNHNGLENKDVKDLRISHQHWKSLIDHIPDWVCRYDKDLKLIFINREGEKLTGKSNDEISGKRNQALKIFDAGTCEKLDEKIQQVFETGEQKILFYKTESQGITRHNFIKIVPEYTGESTEFNSVITLTRDITDLRNYEEKLNSRNNELKNINHYLNDFVYTVAHDLRSPLTNLRLIADLIKSSKDSEDNMFYAQNINSAVSRVDNILNGIIEIINSQFSVDTVIRELNFKDCLERSKDELILRLKKSNASVAYDFQVQKVNYPETYLSSIFRNMISNAIKYRQTGVDPLIEIFTRREGEFVVLEFKDNGSGIDLEKNKRKLFKPFKRLIENQDGKGIGLHLVQSMVEKNGGKIELESEVEKGSRFRIYLKEYINGI